MLLGWGRLETHGQGGAESAPLDIGLGLETQPEPGRLPVFVAHSIPLSFDRPDAVDPAVQQLTHEKSGAGNDEQTPSSAAFRPVLDLAQPIGRGTRLLLPRHLRVAPDLAALPRDVDDFEVR